MKYSEISHSGAHKERIEWNSAERIFFQKWKDENIRKPYLNHGLGILEALVQTKCQTFPSDPFIHGEFEPISQRDAFVAATVIQWLGSTVGACFLAECEKEIREAREKEQLEFHRKHNLHEGGR